MAGLQFQLPKPQQGKIPAVPVRQGPPPIPGRQPAPAASLHSGRPTTSQHGPSFGGKSPPPSNTYTPSPHREVDLPPNKRVLVNLDKKEVDEEVFHSSKIAKIVINKALPLVVELKGEIHHPGCSVEVPKGSQLLLHFLHKTTRIYGSDPLGKDVYLPKYSRQQYTVLPIDPIHDDKLYPTTEALINARPLPSRVRIEEAHFSDHPGEAQEVGDIIEITGVEKRPVPFDSDNPPQKCLIGTCNNVPIAFSESMDCASYSTMPSIDFMSMSEIVNKFPLPLRIRRADKPDQVMILHRMDEEYHVIATCDKLNYGLSIPISWDGDIEVLQSASLDNILPRLLPPLYPLVNPTCSAREPGRKDLPPSMQLVAQPPPEILNPWSRTKEGQEFVLKATKTAVDSYKLRIEELMEEKTRLNNELALYRTSRPPAPLPRESSVPLLPPRPTMSRSLPPSPGGMDDDDDDDAYEEPVPSINRGKSHIPANRQLEELKSLLQERELKIKHLQEKHDRLKRQNAELDTKNASLVENIRKLQMQMDKLEAANDPTYDSLQTGEYAYPNTGPIYSEGGTGRVAVERGFRSLDENGVAALLREMRLEAHVPKFKENSINGELLCDLDEEDLYSEVGMSRIQAKRLMLEVKKRAKLSK